MQDVDGALLDSNLVNPEEGVSSAAPASDAATEQAAAAAAASGNSKFQSSIWSMIYISFQNWTVIQNHVDVNTLTNPYKYWGMFSPLFRRTSPHLRSFLRSSKCLERRWILPRPSRRLHKYKLNTCRWCYACWIYRAWIYTCVWLPPGKACCREHPTCRCDPYWQYGNAWNHIWHGFPSSCNPNLQNGFLGWPKRSRSWSSPWIANMMTSTRSKPSSFRWILQRHRKGPRLTHMFNIMWLTYACAGPLQPSRSRWWSSLHRSQRMMLPWTIISAAARPLIMIIQVQWISVPIENNTLESLSIYRSWPHLK